MRSAKSTDSTCLDYIFHLFPSIRHSGLLYANFAAQSRRGQPNLILPAGSVDAEQK